MGKPSFHALFKKSMEGALVRYRLMTFIVGSALIILVFVGVPLQLWAGFDWVAKIEGTIHGYLYLLYLVSAADVARRAHWRLGRILAVVLAGFVPFAGLHRRTPRLPADAPGVDHRRVGGVGRGRRSRSG